MDPKCPSSATLKSIAKTDYFPTEIVRSEYERTQHRIKPGTIATGGQHANTASFSQRRN
jgi:hypothetical protein